MHRLGCLLDPRGPFVTNLQSDREYSYKLSCIQIYYHVDHIVLSKGTLSACANLQAYAFRLVQYPISIVCTEQILRQVALQSPSPLSRYGEVRP